MFDYDYDMSLLIMNMCSLLYTCLFMNMCLLLYASTEGRCVKIN